MATVYTVGHSSHAAEDFVGLLRQHEVQALVEAQAGLFGELEEMTWRSAATTPRVGFVKGTASAVPPNSGQHAALAAEVILRSTHGNSGAF